MGPIYYQRLRHMVSDKYQARAQNGPNDPCTSQPVKGLNSKINLIFYN